MPRFLSMILLPIVLVLSLMSMVGCASPVPGVPVQTGQGVAARGGDADGEVFSTDSQLAGSYMGAAITSSVRNEDRVNSTNAAPAFALNLASDVTGAVTDALQNDAVLSSLSDEMKFWSKRLVEALDDNQRAEATTGLEKSRAAWASRADQITAGIAGMSTNLGSLRALIYAPFYFQSAGEAVTRLDPEAARAAAEGLKNALEPITEAVK